MQFMAVFYWGPEGGGVNVPARWGHGPTPGVEIITSWVAAGAWGAGDEGAGTGRTWVVFEAETWQLANQFTQYMQFVCRGIEVWPVFEYTEQMRAYESGNPEEWPALAAAPADAREAQLASFRQYQGAGDAAEAVKIWRESGTTAVKMALEAARAEQR